MKNLPRSLPSRSFSHEREARHGTHSQGGSRSALCPERCVRTLGPAPGPERRAPRPLSPVHATRSSRSAPEPPPTWERTPRSTPRPHADKVSVSGCEGGAGGPSMRGGAQPRHAPTHIPPLRFAHQRHRKPCTRPCRRCCAAVGMNALGPRCCSISLPEIPYSAHVHTPRRWGCVAHARPGTAAGDHAHPAICHSRGRRCLSLWQLCKTETL